MVRECGGDCASEVGSAVSGDEVEDYVFRTGGVLEDGEDSGYGATEVGGIECHCDVNYRRIVAVVVEVVE